MLTRLYDLFFHRHTWVDMGDTAIIRSRDQVVVGHKFIQRCDTCKNYREIDTGV